MLGVCVFHQPVLGVCVFHQPVLGGIFLSVSVSCVFFCLSELGVFFFLFPYLVFLNEKDSASVFKT